MKKLYATIIALMAIAMSASADTFGTRMYLLGDATANGWNISADMPLMETLSVGKYQWVGELKGDGLFRFKVNHTNGDWKNCYGPAVNGANFESGTMVFWSSDNPDEAPSYKVATTGMYKIEIDLTGAEPRLTVSDGTGLEPTNIKADYPHYIYPIGSALSCGWSLDEAKWSPLKETEFNSGIYAGVIELVNFGSPLNPAELKFLHQADWGEHYGPAFGGTEIYTVGEYDVYQPFGDNKYNILITGVYDVVVNARTHVMTISESGSGIKAVETTATSEAIYNISGTRLATPQRGINIVNGKKIIY